MDIIFNPYTKTTRQEKVKRPSGGPARSENIPAFSSALEKSTGNASATDVEGSTPLGIVSHLLEVQELTFTLQERKNAKKHGTTLLDTLETIRLTLLTGDISDDLLRTLHTLMTQNVSNTITDPSLKEILEEIETRAAVELAKRGYY